MPVEFLTEDQQRRYGCYTEAPSPLQLARYFHFDDRDHQLIAQRRRAQPLGVCGPTGHGTVSGHLSARSHGGPCDRSSPMSPPNWIFATRPVLAQYRTPRHALGSCDADSTRAYGYHDFHEPREVFRLVRWLYTRAWLSAERPSVLFDLATARLVERKVLLPGVTVLERLVARVQDRAAARLWHLLAQLPNAAQQANLEALLARARRRAVQPLGPAPSRPRPREWPCISRRVTTPRRYPGPRRECALARPHSAQSSPRA